MRDIAWDLEKAALAIAATDTRRQIEEDRTRAPRSIKPLLTAISTKLFDPDFNVERMLLLCKVRDHQIPILFRQELGLTPGRYIRLRRLETATALLASSDIGISDVARLIGYQVASGFGRAFRNWMQLSPSEYREKYKAAAKALKTPLALPTPQDWHRADMGGLDNATAKRFLDRFLALHPQVRLTPTAEQPVKITIDGAALEGLVAKEIWRQLAGRSQEEQRVAIGQQFAFTTPALFRHLTERSREEGRKDRARGIYLAELALASIEARVETLGDDAPNYHAEAWARIGNARRMALDFAGAEQAFAMAREMWGRPRSLFRPEIEAEIHSLESALRMNQRRFSHAAELSETAIRLARSLADPGRLVPYLIQRGSVSFYSGDAHHALTLFQEAVDLADTLDQPFLQLSACTSCCAALIATGRHEKAAVALKGAEDACSQFERGVYHHQVQWLHALLASNQGRHDQAIVHFQQARAGFIRFQAMDSAAVVSLDLALLYHQGNRFDDLVLLLSETLPLFEALQVGREYVAAVKLLRQAIKRKHIESHLLQHIGSFLEGMVLLPRHYD